MARTAAIRSFADEPQQADNFESALGTIAQAFARDPPAEYMTRAADGGKEFLPALLRWLRTETQLHVYHLPDFSCVAFMHDEAASSQSSAHKAVSTPAEEEAHGAKSAATPDAAALQQAHATRTAEALQQLGLSKELATLLLLVPPERLAAALQLLMQDMPDTCQRYIAERANCQAVWHLAFMAVLPQCHAQGLGTQMLAHLAAIADARQRHLYLEASTAASRRLYLRHGFEEFATISLPAAGLEAGSKDGGQGTEQPHVFYCMGRPPHPLPVAPIDLLDCT